MQWTCQTCRDPIENAQEGWVEWLTQQSEANGPWVCHSPRLVHNNSASKRANGCQYNQDQMYKHGRNLVNDLPISDLTGPDGLMTLLCYVSEGKFELEEGLELIKRLHIPDYDLVREHFDGAIADQVFEPDTKPSYYSQHQIALTKEWLEDKGY